MSKAFVKMGVCVICPYETENLLFVWGSVQTESLFFLLGLAQCPTDRESLVSLLLTFQWFDRKIRPVSSQNGTRVVTLLSKSSTLAMKSSALLLCRELLAFYEYVICKKLLPVRLLTVFLLCFSDDGIYLGAGTISGSVSVYVSFNLSVNYIGIKHSNSWMHLLVFTS